MFPNDLSARMRLLGLITIFVLRFVKSGSWLQNEGETWALRKSYEKEPSTNRCT